MVCDKKRMSANFQEDKSQKVQSIQLSSRDPPQNTDRPTAKQAHQV